MKQPDLGKKLAQLRLKQELTQEELADLCFLNVRSIQRIESGTSIPRKSTIKRLNKVFNTCLSDENSELDNNFWLICLHLSSIFPIVIPALLIWQSQRQTDGRIDYQAIDVINFQLSMSLYLFVLSLSAIAIIGLLILPFLGIFITMITLMNTFKVIKSQPYRYPLAIRFLKHENYT